MVSNPQLWNPEVITDTYKFYVKCSLFSFFPLASEILTVPQWENRRNPVVITI